MRRVAALLVSSALVLAGCSAAEEVAPEQAPTSSRSATPPEIAAAASDWLSRLPLQDGLLGRLGDEPGADYDATIDAALAYLSLGDDGSASELVTALVRSDSIAEYAGTGKTLDVGNAARLVATVMASGYDPGELSGRSLVHELRSTAQESGRFVDKGGKDGSDTVSQAWAVFALSVADRVPSSGRAFLGAQQCDSGGYPRELSDLPTGDCRPDVSATAITISALLAAKLPAEDARIAAAATWLRDAADSDTDGDFWRDAKGEPDVLATEMATIALVDARVPSGAPMRWLRAQVLQAGANKGAFARDGDVDARATALGITAFASRGYNALFG